MRVHTRQVDIGDQGVERQFLPLCFRAQGFPEYRFKADRGLMTGNGHAALDRGSEGRSRRIGWFRHGIARRRVNTYAGHR